MIFIVYMFLVHFIEGIFILVVGTTQFLESSCGPDWTFQWTACGPRAASW